MTLCWCSAILGTVLDYSVNSILQKGLCTGCGTCAGMCPVDAIRMVTDSKEGLYVPALDRDKCNECGLCLDVCPGHAVDFRQLNRDIFGKEAEDSVLGSYKKCYIGHATDYETRYNSASGGLVTSLLVFALEEGLIDGALVTRMREDRPLEPQTFIARSRDEIVSAARSKYCPVPANIALEEILKAGDGERFAVVGLPCHIQGIRKAEAFSRKLKERIVLHFGILCSHSDSFHLTDFLLQEFAIGKESVAGIDYRGRGWPGYMVIRAKDGGEKAIRYDQYITLHTGYFFTPRRCTLCCDAGARLADVSFMDAWLPEVKARDNVGTSILVCRTERGEDICRRANLRSVVDLKELPRGDVLRSQGRARMSNKDLKAHMRFARLYGMSAPTYAIGVPRSGLLNYLRCLVIHFNMLVSSRIRLRRVIAAMVYIESRMLRLVKART